MSQTQRIDDIINGLEPIQENEKTEIVTHETEPQADQEVSRDAGESLKDNAFKDPVEKPEKVSKDIGKESKLVEPKASDSDTDEYGIEVPKARTYSEEEVQRMIRDRLSRGQHAQPTQQQAVQNAADNFQMDPNSTDPWEVQLEQFVKHTIGKVERENSTRQMQREETERQTNFEVKFSTGMEKFSDFKDVVGKVPITDSMMMSIRDMDNPATFIYAAAKLQPKEIERIAALKDPFQQAKEMGRLDERMRKAKNISKTAPPLAPTKSDFVESRVQAKKNIDGLIQVHAKSKLRPTK